MTEPLAEGRPSRRSPLDPWRDAFVTELRLHDVAGARIGDALAEVDAHCDESQQSPADAFGDPESYAVALVEALPAAPADPSADAGAVLVGVGALLGSTLLVAGLGGVAGGGAAQFSAGALVGAAVVGVVLLGLVPRMAALLRPRRRGLLAAIVGGTLALVVLVSALLPATVLTLPAWACVVAGAALLVAAGLVLLRIARRSGDDAVLDPRTGDDSLATPRWLLPLAVGVPVVSLAVAVVLAMVLGGRA
ncbi:MAG: hypothetical protein ABIS35_04975 [Terracoccus sp.]